MLYDGPLSIIFFPISEGGIQEYNGWGIAIKNRIKKNLIIYFYI